MAEPEPDWRRVGWLTDARGQEVIVGTRGDLMTISVDSDSVFLDGRGRAELHALWMAATVTIDTWKAARPAGDDGG